MLTSCSLSAISVVVFAQLTFVGANSDRSWYSWQKLLDKDEPSTEATTTTADENKASVKSPFDEINERESEDEAEKKTSIKFPFDETAEEETEKQSKQKTPIKSPFDDIRERESDEEAGETNLVNTPFGKLPKSVLEEDDISKTPFGMIKEREYNQDLPYGGVTTWPPTGNGYYFPDRCGHNCGIHPAIYNIYPILHPKGPNYCQQMEGRFIFTCQPSKPLRLDLLEFCKEYSSVCNVPNFHNMPGPRLGSAQRNQQQGNIGIGSRFGFGIGLVPGFEVDAGWDVNVGPIPGLDGNVGVKIPVDVNIMGANPPEQVRRGMSDPWEKGRGGLVGVSGGVGVETPYTGQIGYMNGIGVGRFFAKKT